MQARLVPILPHLWRGLVALLTLEVALVAALQYFAVRIEAPQFVLDNGNAHPFLVLHILGGMTALLLGPLQFVRRIRARTPALHRFVGRGYVIACAVGAPAGLMLALGTQAGPVAAVGFALPALLWPAFTWLGWRAAVERRFAAHREWMLRSYAMTFNAITLRLMLPLAAVMGLDFMPAYRAISWLSWIVTLAGFELYLRQSRGRARPAAA